MPATPTPAITVVAAIIRGEDGRICLSKRPDHKHQGGRWEFPGGKVEPGEPLADALARELHEELAMEEALSSPFMTIAHQYEDIHVTLHFRDVTAWRGVPEGQEGQQVAWFAPGELAELNFPAANRPVVTAISLPPCLAIAPEAQDPETLMARIQGLDAARTGLYLRNWSQHPERDRILEVCARHDIRVWLRADSPAGLVGGLPDGVFGLHLPASVLADCEGRPAFAGVVSAACHDQQALEKAVRLGLDSALISPVNPTTTHPDQPALGWETAGQWATGLPLACYMLGGVGPGDLTKARQHGAVGVAGIRAFWPAGA
ncbi:MAG: Nudix family hydrolase [Pseudomonadales bacterium]|nr:Nudix family hydrolase [Pseudomonadales bacterium]